ncbi:MAG: sigma-70 family RNA polymerase sigma factor [Caldilineaceae bacterium]|nr:sigma-70 family RNA polymerase sigma factor [Caldilineaceae bacterium]
MTDRTNEQWITALQGQAREAALEDLRSLLLRGLRGALAGTSKVVDADLEDFVQEALIKILGDLDSFRGKSRFATWAQKISVRVAYSELRRKRWQDWSLEGMASGTEGLSGELMAALLADSTVSPEQQAVRNMLLGIVRRTITEKLTERQRFALVMAVVHGVPMEEIARRMGTNRNALYKLLHDARSRLKQELLASGLQIDEILEAFQT